MKDVFGYVDSKLFAEFLDAKMEAEGLVCVDCKKPMKRDRKYLFICDECSDKMDEEEKAFYERKWSGDDNT